MAGGFRGVVRNIEAGLAAGLLAGLSSAAIETALAYSKDLSTSQLIRSFVVSAFTVLLPFGVLGFLIGIAFALLFGGESARSRFAEWNARSGVASSVLAWGLVAVGVFAVLQPVHDRITSMFINDFKNKDLSGWMLNLVEYTMLAGAVVIVVGAARLVKPIFVWLGRPFKFLPPRFRLFLSLSVVGLTAYWLFIRLVWRAIEPFEGNDRLAIQGVFCTAFGTLVLALVMLIKRRHRGAWVWGLRGLGYGVAVLIFVAAPGASRDSMVLSRLNGHAPMFKTLSAYYTKLADIDGDRFGSFMGGADTAPFDPWAYPGAPEVAGNGKDDNCLLGDPPKGAKPKHDPGFVELPPELQDRDFNILFITMDAVRADHLSCYGYKRKTSPNIDALAGRGTLFEHAYSQGTGTIISIPSFMSGLYISQIECQNLSTTPEGHRLAPETLLLPDYLRDKGYMTIAVGAHGYLALVDSQDWDIFSNPPDKQVGGGDISSPELTERALKFAHKYLPEYKTFMWVHYYDPHDQYLPHPDDDVKFGRSKVDLYDGEIHYTDKYIGKLIAEWEKISPLPTVIIVSADHGESLGEHGIPYHNYNFYDSIVHVPLIFYIPGVKGGRRIKSPVALIDIFPTIRNLLGDKPLPKHLGRSLLGEILHGREYESRVVFHEAQFEQFKKFYAKRGITTNRYRFIWDMLSGAEELYDLITDPKEEHNLVAQQPELADRMRNLLYRTMEDVALTMPRFNYCNYRPKKGAFRYYPKAPREFYEKYLHNKLPANAGKRVSVKFGDYIELLAYKVEPTTLSEQREVWVHLYFKAHRVPRDNYKLFVHLRGVKGSKWGKFSLNYDHYPVDNLLPVIDWQKGWIVEDVFRFQLPRGKGKGKVKLYIGFYSPQRKERLKVRIKRGGLRAKDNRVLLAVLRIKGDVIKAERISMQSAEQGVQTGKAPQPKTLPQGGK